MALVEFLSIFLLGFVSGVSFSHLLQRGPKKTLPAPQFLAIQQVLLRNYGPAVGGLEVAALFSTLAMAIVAWGHPVVPVLATTRDVSRADKDFLAETLSRLGERRVRAGLTPPGLDRHVCACRQKTFHAAQASRPEPIRRGRQQAAPG